MATDTTDVSLTYTLPFQLTKTIRREVYDYISPYNPANSQSGKIVLITGGGTGIGAAAARVWIEAGAEGVILAARRQNVLDNTSRDLRELAKSLGKDTKVLAVSTDMTVFSQLENLFKQAKSHFGRVPDVVIANAGAVNPLEKVADVDVDTWWHVWEVNLRGVHNAVTAFIRSQDDPKNPVGTIINVNSGLAGMLHPRNAAYSISKFAANRYMEYVELDYPTLRAFTLLPGVVKTDMLYDDYDVYAQDEPELTGALALYLAQDRADFLKGSLTSVNWDVQEMEARKEDVVKKGLLKTTWMPILPVNGGSGF